MKEISIKYLQSLLEIYTKREICSHLRISFPTLQRIILENDIKYTKKSGRPKIRIGA